ncbi:MAG: DUF4417 domain-containing protein [Galactobacillus timonensis]|uniref:DUF4417 domain-containing protein n=1 Tax=Galactobacillus timonensis TaxID=2041840 RepID=UPI0023F26AA5|nr:DUF4417 domain-containing protein [Galactobacillus timonensis]MCI6068239.1 DUF4417 domain-containing protein [Galactobacillus timonensis]
MKKQLKHIVVNINDLKPAAYNPREELRPGDPEYENIKNSIQEFGYADAIVVNKDLTVIGGHQRLNVLKDLGYSDIEVAQVDLTKKQEKALNIALNKITGRWDDNKLTDLFKDLNADDFDLELTGFDIDEIDELIGDEGEAIDYKGATQEQVSDILNLGKAQFPGAGKYDIPIIQPVFEIPEGVEDWIGFNYAMSEKEPEKKAVHFFVDDYQFERVWNRPDDYVDLLKRFKCVLAPDFSPYGDMPLAAQIWNHYRKHWCAAYWQSKGVNVIPTIRSSTDKRSLSFYLDGEPRGGVIAYSSMWAKEADEVTNDLFKSEWNKMIHILKPKTVIVYGNVLSFFRESKVNIIQIDKFSDKRWRGKQR